MQSAIISVLAGASSSVVVGLVVSLFRKLAKDVDKAEITVVNTRTGKTATLPRKYSPTAVEQLLEVTA